MKKPLEYHEQGVWIARGDSLPLNLKYATGVVIVLGGEKRLREPEEDRVHACTVFFLSSKFSQQPFHFSAKIAFLTGGRTERKLPSISDWMDGGESESPQFITLADFQKDYWPLVISLGSRRSYATIFGNLGPNFGRRWLLAANELAALNEFRPGSRLLEEVRTSPHGLWSEFFREDEERFALIDFPRTVNVGRRASRSLADTESLYANVPLWKEKFELPLSLTFPVVLGQRQLQNVIIGPNGSGKTNLLLGLAKCVIARQIEINHEDSWPHYSQADRIPIVVFTYERSMWSRLGRDNVEIYEQGVRASNWRQLTQLIYEFGTRDDSDYGVVDLRLLVEILSGFIDVGDIRLPVFPLQVAIRRGARLEGDDLEIALTTLAESPPAVFRELASRLDRGRSPIMRSRNGYTYELSSGERSLTLFCSRLMKASRNSALVLIDEPENHLHPRFITLMIQALSRSLQATGSRALLVTHSPFVVREFERSAVKVMKRNANGIPELLRPTMQTLGGDVSMISDYVFEDDEIRKGFEESIDRAIRERQLHTGVVGAKKLAESLAEGLGEDAMNYLFARSEAVTKSTSDA